MTNGRFFAIRHSEFVISARPQRKHPLKAESHEKPAQIGCDYVSAGYLSRPMPKPIARSKTRKAVAKRFKITARGKVLRAQSSRRHLLSAKNAKRKRQLSKAARVDKTDEARVKANLPFA
jgi:large subunit ribosomal protein L35